LIVLPKSFVEKATFFTACLIPVLIFSFIIWLRPFWGPMDDSNFVLTFIPRMLREGIFKVSGEYAVGDLSWGMFRPLYPAMTLFIYWPGMQTAPWVSYLWNAFWIFCIVGGYCTFLARALRLSVPLVILACASFFYAWDLFQHLSLQEKMVLTAGLGTVWLAWSRSRFSSLRFWFLFPFVTLVGVCTKASFPIHYSVAVMAFAASSAGALKRGDRKAWLEMGVVILLGILQVLAFAKISAGGSYTHQYDFHKILPNFFSLQGAMLWIPLVLALAALSLRRKEVWQNPELLLPVTGVSAFLVLFLPWGIQAYVQSVMAPFFAAMLVQLAGWWLGRVPRAYWVLPLCVLALSVTVYRGATMFGRLSDLGKVTELGTDFYKQGVKEIWMPCEEGSGSMNNFLKTLPAPTPDVHFLDTAMPSGEKFVIFDGALCPLSGRADSIPGCQMNVLWRGEWPRSYRLAKVVCP